MTPSERPIIATRSSGLPQPSSIHAITEFLSAVNLDRVCVRNFKISDPLKRYGEVKELKINKMPFFLILPFSFEMAISILERSLQSA